MYRNEETRISYNYLVDVIHYLDEPICLMGGWAVYFIVNSLFEKEKGYSYLGSRDIDLGFNNINTLKKAIAKLENLGFRKISFRFFKEIHSETKKELNKDEAKKTPLHYIFPMYVDLIISKNEPSLKSQLGFMPIDEPLLKYVFDTKKYQKELKKFHKNVIIPSPSLLLAMKICSLKGRDKEDKKIKDICDLTAVCLYSGVDINRLKQEALIFNDTIKKNLGIIDTEDIRKVSRLLALEESVIFDIIEKLMY